MAFRQQTITYPAELLDGIIKRATDKVIEQKGVKFVPHNKLKRVIAFSQYRKNNIWGIDKHQQIHVINQLEQNNYIRFITRRKIEILKIN